MTLVLLNGEGTFLEYMLCGFCLLEWRKEYMLCDFGPLEWRPYLPYF